MARRGFLARLGDLFKNAGKALDRFFGGGPEEPPERPSPPPPPRPPGEGGGGPLIPRDFQIWQDRAIGADRYNADAFRDWQELYQNSVAPLQMDREEELQFWDEFLRAFYLTRGERGSVSRDRFYRDIGIRKSDFEMDWQEWREIKRGTP